MATHKFNFYVFTALSLSVGIVLGTVAARHMLSVHKEKLTIDHSTAVRQAPSNLADFASLNKNDQLTVIAQADYSKSTTVVKVNKDLRLQDKNTHQLYIIKEGSYCKVSSKTQKGYKIEAQTNKNNTVQLELNLHDVTPLEDGHWKQVQDSKGKTGWLKVK